MLKLGDVLEVFGFHKNVQPAMLVLETSVDTFERLEANSALMSAAFEVSGGDALLAGDLMAQVYRVTERADDKKSLTFAIR